MGLCLEYRKEGNMPVQCSVKLTAHTRRRELVAVQVEIRIVKEVEEEKPKENKGPCQRELALR